MNHREKFAEIYRHEAPLEAFCPYRICPLGAHIDHQHGIVTGMCIDKGLSLAYEPRDNGLVELQSLNFPGQIRFGVADVPKLKQNDWADYMRGATIALSKLYPLKRGLAGVFYGTMPTGGLSSSAAVTISYLTALCHVNAVHLTANELIEVSLAAETRYVGLACGRLDESCEVLCRKKQLLYLDTRDGNFECIQPGPDMKPFVIGIFFSGLEHALPGSAYNTRVDECKSAAYALKAFAGIPYGRYADTRLRELPPDVFACYKDKLPMPWRMRAEHYYGEMERVRLGIEAWRKGDIEAFGQQIFASGRSSIDKYEAGSPELKLLHESLHGCEGVYGARFSGAGFKGCCMALVAPAKQEAVRESVSKQYLRAFPEMEGKYFVCYCHSADGVRP